MFLEQDWPNVAILITILNVYTYPLYFMALAYILAGANHFRAPEFYMPMMPNYIPRPKLMIYLSGMAEILLGALLLPEATRSLAALGIVAMLVVFFTVHVYMVQMRNSIFKKIPVAIIYLRIPFQFLLIYWAYQYT